jgi:lysozyme
MCTYTVQPGDTLSWVAQSMGVGMYELSAANGIANPNLIFVGQVLVNPNCNQMGGGYGAEYGAGYGADVPAVAGYAPEMAAGAAYGAEMVAVAAYGPEMPAVAGYGPEMAVSAEYAADMPAVAGYGPEMAAGAGYGADMTTPVSYGAEMPASTGSGPETVAGADMPAVANYGDTMNLPASSVQAYPAAGAEGWAAPVAAMPAGGNSYTVVAGDNLSRIAASYGVSVRQISEANGIQNPNIVYVGQLLIIP